jgi:molecular chaperone DnaK (HSP70)
MANYTGIDLGTTNSLIAAGKRRAAGYRPRGTGKALRPSVVARADGAVTVGRTRRRDGTAPHRRARRPKGARGRLSGSEYGAGFTRHHMGLGGDELAPGSRATPSPTSPAVVASRSAARFYPSQNFMNSALAGNAAPRATAKSQRVVIAVPASSTTDSARRPRRGRSPDSTSVRLVNSRPRLFHVATAETRPERRGLRLSA